MQQQQADNPQFEIEFYEQILEKHPSYTEVIEALGSLYNKMGRFEDGLTMDRKLVELNPNDPVSHYNLGCSYALLHQEEQAFKELEQAIVLGYKDYQWMATDPDLKHLHTKPKFVELLDRVKSNTNK